VESSLLEILYVHAFIIIAEIFVLFSLLHMLYQRRTPTSMISWLLLFIVLPYLSVILYFLIGVRKRPDEKSKSYLQLQSMGKTEHEINPIDGILQANGICDVSHRNDFRLIIHNVEAFHALMQAIKNAKESISFSTYVFKSDSATKLILAALTQKAKEGVKVRLLIDSLGSYPLYFNRLVLKKLQAAGGEVSFFMPLLRLPYQNYINLRNHRKIYLFDNTLLYSGGMNLAKEYLAPVGSSSQWEDMLFSCQGEAVYEYAQIFEADWAYASKQPRITPLPPKLPQVGNVDMQVVPSGPDIKGDALLEALLSAIYSAKERIWIVTPYFVPDKSMMQALSIAKHKGVDVRLITPKNSNHLIADLSRSSYMRELQESGIELVLYKGGMLHAKAILFDDAAAMIGSVNIDNRSLLLNYEVVSFVYSEETIEAVESWMNGFITNSDAEMPQASRSRRIVENFMRILAPQL